MRVRSFLTNWNFLIFYQVKFEIWGHISIFRSALRENGMTLISMEPNEDITIKTFASA